MPKATVTTRGRITIPASVRRDLGIVPGDNVSFTQVADGHWAMHAAYREDEAESASGVSNSTGHNWDAWFDGGGTSEDFSPR